MEVDHLINNKEQSHFVKKQDIRIQQNIDLVKIKAYLYNV